MYFSVLFSTILLLFVPLTGAYKPVLKHGSTKPGTCPEDNALCRRHYGAKCQKDEECRDKQKCCFYYCLFTCKHTVEDRLSEVKEGFCQDIQGQCEKKTPSDTCTCDGDCRGLYKCCPGACGKQCLRPHSGKVGTCPDIIYPCSTQDRNKCERHRDCPGTLMCCLGICGKQCMDTLNPDIPKLDKETEEKITKFQEMRRENILLFLERERVRKYCKDKFAWVFPAL